MDRPAIIDRDAPVPIYYQIANDIMNRIAMGEWSVGDKLPSESQMHQEYGVSVITLRQALRHLEEANLITKHQGKGTFLSDTPKPFVEDLVLPSLKYKGKTASPTRNRIVEWKCVENVPADVRQLFSIPEEGPFVFLRRLFLRNNRLIGLNDVWFPEALVPNMIEQGLVDNSITATLLTRYGYHITCIDNYIESAKLNATEAALLEADYAAPVLRILSIHSIADGSKIEYSSTLWLGNLTRFHFTVKGE